MTYDRRSACKQELMKAWTDSDNDEQRIPILQGIVKKYPEFTAPLSELASAFLSICDIDKALEIYQQLTEHPSDFEDACPFILGKAYLLSDQPEKAIECFLSENCSDDDQELFLAFACLKIGDREKALELFGNWITTYAERAFKVYSYRKYFKPVFGEFPNNSIIESWANYHKIYSEMASYDLYCMIYDQKEKKYRSAAPSDNEPFDDRPSEFPPKLSKSEFIRLSLEFLDIDRKCIYKDRLSSEAHQRMDELRDLIFADIIY